MDSYIVRIYRRAGKKPRILIGTVEAAGTRTKMAFSNIEELWEILRRRKGGDVCTSPPSPLRLRKEVMSGEAETGLERSAEGAPKVKPASRY